jgi:hypothetical protein
MLTAPSRSWFRLEPRAAPNFARTELAHSIAPAPAKSSALNSESGHSVGAVHSSSFDCKKLWRKYPSTSIARKPLGLIAPAAMETAATIHNLRSRWRK